MTDNIDTPVYQLSSNNNVPFLTLKVVVTDVAAGHDELETSLIGSKLDWITFK